MAEVVQVVESLVVEVPLGEVLVASVVVVASLEVALAVAGKSF